MKHVTTEIVHCAVHGGWEWTVVAGPMWHAGGLAFNEAEAGRMVARYLVLALDHAA